MWFINLFWFWYIWSISLTKVSENSSSSTENILNLEVLKKELTEKKDNLTSAFADLEMDENIQKLANAVYERENTDLGECWLSQMEMSNILLQNVHVTLPRWLNICRLLMLCFQECLSTTIIVMVNGSQFIGIWQACFHMERKNILMNILLN